MVDKWGSAFKVFSDSPTPEAWITDPPGYKGTVIRGEFIIVLYQSTGLALPGQLLLYC